MNEKMSFIIQRTVAEMKVPLLVITWMLAMGYIMLRLFSWLFGDVPNYDTFYKIILSTYFILFLCAPFVIDTARMEFDRQQKEK